MDSRCRHHREAALWPSGSGGGELQPAQAGTAVAQLSLLHAGQLTSDPGGGSTSRQSSYLEAFGAGSVAPAGRAFADGKAHVAARRRRLGQRADHAGGGEARPAYLFKLRLTNGVKRTIERAMRTPDWHDAGAGWQGKEGDLRLQG
jgi:hypothetical protein